jgi:hypothetical protein
MCTPRLTEKVMHTTCCIRKKLCVQLVVADKFCVTKRILINYLTKIYHSKLYVKVMSTNCEKELKDHGEGTGAK